MTHWGDIPAPPDVEPDSGIAAIEREQMTKPRPVELEGPKLHQPTTLHRPPTKQPYQTSGFTVDPVVMHTVQLVQYSHKIKSLITNFVEQRDVLRQGQGDFASVPPLPEFPRCTCPIKPQSRPTSLPSRSAKSDFVNGRGQPLPEIDTNVNRKLLRRSAITIAAHAGFDAYSDCAADVLTSVLHEYLVQMTQLLRHAVDAEALNGSIGFSDPIEKVFHEMGIGSPTVLHDFYQRRVLCYHSNMMAKCQKLAGHYEAITKGGMHLSIKEEFPMFGVKDEPPDDIIFPVAVEDLEEEGLLAVALSFDMNQEMVEEQKPPVPCKSEKMPLLEPLETDDHPGLPSVPAPFTPHISSDCGDELDILSPPSIGLRISGKTPKKKRKL